MGWSVDEVRRRREALEKEDAKKKGCCGSKGQHEHKGGRHGKERREHGCDGGCSAGSGVEHGEKCDSGCPAGNGLEHGEGRHG